MQVSGAKPSNLNPKPKTQNPKPKTGGEVSGVQAEHIVSQVLNPKP